MRQIDLSQYKKPTTTPSVLPQRSIDLSQYRTKPVSTAPVQPTEYVSRNVPKPAENVGAAFIHGFSAPGRTIQNKVVDFLGLPESARPQEKQFDTLGGKIANTAGEIAPFLSPGSAPTKATKALPYLKTAAGRLFQNSTIAGLQSDDLKEGVTTGLVAETLGPIGKAMSAVGRGAYTKLAIPLSKREAGLLQAYQAGTPFKERIAGILKGTPGGPTTAADTAFNKGFMGTESMIGVQAKRATKTLWDDLISPSLKRVDDTIDNISAPAFFDDIATSIKKNNPELTRQKSLLNALDAMKDDYKGVETFSFSQLQKFKEGWAKFVPEKVYRGENVAGALREVQHTAASKARTMIHDAIDDPAVRQAYYDYGNLLGLQQWGQRAMTGGKFKGGTGGFLSALKDAVLTPIATVGGQVIYKTGQGIEFIAPAGAKTLHDIINAVSPPSTDQ